MSSSLKFSIWKWVPKSDRHRVIVRELLTLTNSQLEVCHSVTAANENAREPIFDFQIVADQ